MKTMTEVEATIVFAQSYRGSDWVCTKHLYDLPGEVVPWGKIDERIKELQAKHPEDLILKVESQAASPAQLDWESDRRHGRLDD